VRKLSAIFVLCCLLFLTAGYHLLYHYRIAEARQEMKQRLLSANKEGLTRLVLSNEELRQLAWEDAKEFHYRGEMYDVVRLVKNAGGMTIWCLPDQKEEALLDHYFKTRQRSSEHSSDTILKVLATQYLLPSATMLSAPAWKGEKPVCLYTFFLPQISALITTPPPRVCSFV
jgi:hypothetical protein